MQESLKSRDSGLSKSYKIDFIDKYYQARNLSIHELLNQTEGLQTISKYNWSKQNSLRQTIDLNDKVKIEQKKAEVKNIKYK